jgi:hypothetical protein
MKGKKNRGKGWRAGRRDLAPREEGERKKGKYQFRKSVVKAVSGQKRGPGWLLLQQGHGAPQSGKFREVACGTEPSPVAMGLWVSGWHGEVTGGGGRDGPGSRYGAPWTGVPNILEAEGTGASRANARETKQTTLETDDR